MFCLSTGLSTGKTLERGCTIMSYEQQRRHCCAPFTYLSCTTLLPLASDSDHCQLEQRPSVDLKGLSIPKGLGGFSLCQASCALTFNSELTMMILWALVTCLTWLLTLLRLCFGNGHGKQLKCTQLWQGSTVLQLSPQGTEARVDLLRPIYRVRPPTWVPPLLLWLACES